MIYQNGNTTVEIQKDGTKIRSCDDVPVPVFPESIDLKVTSYCDLSCAFCHEDSTKKGKHANLDDYHFLIDQLPSGVELAIGGGNPMSHPDIVDFLLMARDKCIICNMTMNELHLKPYKEQLTDLIKANLIKGLGVSYDGSRPKELEYFSNLTPNLVFHVIMGVHPLSCLNDIKKYSEKVLILGYKQFRRGVLYHSKAVEDNKYLWYIHLPKHFGSMTLSFDNLAIDQLNLHRWFTDDSWDTFYMGDDGTFTMYVDAVRNEYAVSSITVKRRAVNNDIKSMFANVRG